MTEPANGTQEAPGSPRNTAGAVEPGVVSKTGGQGWDHRETFWRQWDRVLHLRTFPGPSQDFTGAVEGLALLSFMVADERFTREWDKRPLHQTAPGGPLFATLQDNQAALEIIARLVARKGWAEKQRKVSVLAPWKGPESGNGKNGSAEASSGPLTVKSVNGVVG